MHDVLYGGAQWLRPMTLRRFRCNGLKAAHALPQYECAVGDQEQRTGSGHHELPAPPAEQQRRGHGAEHHAELVGQLRDGQYALELVSLEDLREHDFARYEALARKDAAAGGQRNQPADSAPPRIAQHPRDTDDGAVRLADTHQFERGEAVTECAEQREEQIARQRLEKEGDA